MSRDQDLCCRADYAGLFDTPRISLARKCQDKIPATDYDSNSHQTPKRHRCNTPRLRCNQSNRGTRRRHPRRSIPQVSLRTAALSGPRDSSRRRRSLLRLGSNSSSARSTRLHLLLRKLVPRVHNTVEWRRYRQLQKNRLGNNTSRT